MEPDIIDRAEDCLRYGLIGSPIVTDLIAAVKSARAEALLLVEEKQELRDKLVAARTELAAR